MIENKESLFVCDIYMRENRTGREQIRQRTGRQQRTGRHKIIFLAV